MQVNNSRTSAATDAIALALTTTALLSCVPALPSAPHSCRTVLTHFSQRYPRMPSGYPADARPWRKRPLLAVDGAVVRFDLLPVLPALMPAVAAALEDVAAQAEQEQEEQQEDAGEQEQEPARHGGGNGGGGGCCC